MPPFLAAAYGESKRFNPSDKLVKAGKIQNLINVDCMEGPPKSNPIPVTFIPEFSANVDAGGSLHSDPSVP